MSVKERIRTYIKFKNISERAFCRSIGVSETYVSSMRTSLQPDKVHSIALQYPDLNTGWLLTGEGDMLKNNVTGDVFFTEMNSNVKKAPLIRGQYAYAGYLSGYADPEYLNEQPIYYSMHAHNGGNYIAFEVRGDSMDDNSRTGICQGDIVLGCELKKEHWRYKLHIPKVFIIVHKENGITIKQIIDHDVDEGNIVCHSWNKSPEYKDFTLNLSDVKQLFYIKEINRDFDL